MKTEADIEIDAETGLPVLPEGYFWRVGTDRGSRAFGDWDDPMVQIMHREMVEVRKERVFLGIGFGYKTVEEMGAVVDTAQSFDRYADDKSEIPEDATNIKGYLSGAGKTKYQYTLPLSEENISLIAKESFVRFSNAEENLARYEAKRKRDQELKDKFYGDYPPKTLK
jgi:hypothetical protein